LSRSRHKIPLPFAKRDIRAIKVLSKCSREFSQMLYPTSICKGFVPRESETAKIRGRKHEEERHGRELNH
jgi:hypothetical protein